MYWGGITQSLMWKEFTSEGVLRYPVFLETVTQILPMYLLRVVGGSLYIVGALFATWNLYKTAKSGSLLANEAAEAPALERLTTSPAPEYWHRKLEGRPLRFAVLSLVAVLIGGIVEFVPTAVIKSNIPTIATVKPYSPLEVEGRDIYIAEGCNNCHSQMIRPFRSETERYGEYSKVGEFVYDHPFLWGSKRTGPDLHREGGRYPDSWHYLHMREPRSTSPGSIMPAYTWLYDDKLDYSHTEGKIITLRKLGVPYPYGYEIQAVSEAQAQAKQIAANLEQAGAKTSPDAQIVALIAYLQRLGTDIKAKPAEVKAQNKGATETAQK